MGDHSFAAAREVADLLPDEEEPDDSTQSDGTTSTGHGGGLAAPVPVDTVSGSLALEGALRTPRARASSQVRDPLVANDSPIRERVAWLANVAKTVESACLPRYSG